MRDIHTHTLGCKVNFADVQAVSELLRGSGGGAELGEIDTGCRQAAALVGTCCVTAEGEKQSRKEVRRAARQVGPGGRVFVTGCAARLRPGAFGELGDNVMVVTGDPREVAAAIQAELDGGRAAGEGVEARPAEPALRARPPVEPASAPAMESGAEAEQVPGGSCQPESSVLHPRLRTRFFLKIQDGCANDCSYCVIPQVRGLPRSIPAETVLATGREMVAAGYPELVVSGINAGAWRGGGHDLAWLIDRLARVDGLVRLRLSSIEVTALTPELLDAIGRHPLIGRHLHLPLQSGDDGVLAAMGRRYDTAAFAEAVSRVRRALPEVNITTDAIVGFPAEDEGAFANTAAFAEAAGVTRIHVFSYSPRPGTAADRLGDLVPPAEKKRRSGVLRELSGRLQQAHRQRKLGVTSEILLESSQSPGVHGGYSSDYTRYAVAGGRPGALVRVRGEAVGANGIEGKVVEA